MCFCEATGIESPFNASMLRSTPGGLTLGGLTPGGSKPSGSTPGGSTPGGSSSIVCGQLIAEAVLLVLSPGTGVLEVSDKGTAGVLSGGRDDEGRASVATIGSKQQTKRAAFILGEIIY